MPACRECELGLLHCHGTLVIHLDGAHECTADTCRGPRETHVLVLKCDEGASHGCQVWQPDLAELSA